MSLQFLNLSAVRLVVGSQRYMRQAGDERSAWDVFTASFVSNGTFIGLWAAM
jgi:hypothetical protein